jgi:hypothetical protein
MMQRRFRAWLSAGLFAVMASLAVAMPARAAILTYSYTYTSSALGTVAITGTFTVDSDTNQITSIVGSGTPFGTVTGILATNTLVGNDNLFSSAAPYLTELGVAFSTTNIAAVNIYYDDEMETYNLRYLYNGTIFSVSGGALTVTALTTAVPEPGSMALLLSGLAGVGMVARRRRGGAALAA